MSSKFRHLIPYRCAAVLSLAALSACDLGPHYQRPQIPTPTTWSSVPAAGGAAGQGSAPAAATGSAPAAIQDTWPQAAWWEGFRSRELDGLIRQAQEANDDLAAAVARVQQADAQARIAGAPLLPSLGAGFTPERQSQFLPLNGGGLLTFTSFTAQLTAAYELDFWGKNLALRQAALQSARASRFDRETVELTVLSSVATTYFTALSLRERIGIAVANVAAARQTLDGLRLEQSVGTSTALDVAQQQTVVETEDATIPALQAQLQQNLAALATLVGRTPEDLPPPTAHLTDVAEPQLVAGLPSQLLARRPDVASAEAQLIAANADVRAARAAFFPTIDLTASGGYESTALSTLLVPGSRIFSLGAGITQPIFQGGALLGQYQLNKGRYAELLADYHKAVISAFSNVETALTAVQETAEQLRRQQRAAQTAQRAYDFAQAQFHAGTINILNVLTTETSLLSAQDTLAQVKLAHLSALVGLYQALGGGWNTEQEP
ncbi:MAG TPA: efflux transporter outer membrane subunit [Steroidobacteraceae bacterium]|nr:efflux transporter outer membrane subunit [Steroidobacteraceae bacterium]